MSEQNETMNQLKGGSLANLIFAVIFIAYRIFSAKCKHTKCKSHTKCCDFESREDSEENSKAENELHREIEKLQESFTRISSGLRTRRQTVIPFIEQGRSTKNDQMAEKSDIENQI